MYNLVLLCAEEKLKTQIPEKNLLLLFSSLSSLLITRRYPQYNDSFNDSYSIPRSFRITQDPVAYYTSRSLFAALGLEKAVTDSWSDLGGCCAPRMNC